MAKKPNNQKICSKHRLYIMGPTKKKIRFKCRYCPVTRHFYRTDIRERLGIFKWPV